MTDGHQQDEDWLRLELLSPRPDHDSAVLAELGALGVEVRDEDTYVVGVEFPPVPAGLSRLIAYFEGDTDAEALETRVEETLPDAEAISAVDYGDRSWETAWMEYFQAIELSDRVAVGPPWDRPKAPPGGVGLVIEPGMAFGTGSHATTRLAVRLLDGLIADRAVDSVLDVGCGSGILSMAASGLGVDRVVGLDNDPRAVDAADTNLAENGFTADDIDLSTTPLGKLDETFEMVVANILAPILIDLSDDLLDAVAEGGDLVLSGIAEDRLAEVREAFEAPGFREVRCEKMDDWRALQFRRKAS